MLLRSIQKFLIIITAISLVGSYPAQAVLDSGLLLENSNASTVEITDIPVSNVSENLPNVISSQELETKSLSDSPISVEVNSSNSSNSKTDNSTSSTEENISNEENSNSTPPENPIVEPAPVIDPIIIPAPDPIDEEKVEETIEPIIVPEPDPILEENNEPKILETEKDLLPTILIQPTTTGKIITVSFLDEQKLTTPIINFPVHIEIPEIYSVGQENKINLTWKNNEDKKIDFTVTDDDKNGLLDSMDWVVPEISSETPSHTFEVSYIFKALRLDSEKKVLRIFMIIFFPKMKNMFQWKMVNMFE